MSARWGLVSAASRLFAITGERENHQRVAAIMGCSRTMVSRIVVGERDLSDQCARRLIDGLRDHAVRADRLADRIEREISTKPRPNFRGGGERDDCGRFAGASF